MGDVADILGVKQADSLVQSNGIGGINTEKIKAKKPSGMSREVFRLVGHSDLPPIMPTTQKDIQKMFKEKRSLKAIKWSRKPFTNSARSDGLVLHHWAKDSVMVADYPFSRFNTTCSTVVYTEEEYSSLVAPSQSDWTKEETDQLIHLCKHYDLRWIVIADRFHSNSPRDTEALKARYYEVAKLLSSKDETKPRKTKKFDIPPEYTFNDDHERQRKRQLELMFTRSPVEEKRLERLEKELEGIEQQLKKSCVKVDETKKQELADVVLNIKREVPSGVYLRSICHNLPPQSVSMSDKMVAKMNMMLGELGVPARPLPTASVCDIYDRVRRDIVGLLSLQKKLSFRQRENFTLNEKMKSLKDPTYTPKMPPESKTKPKPVVVGVAPSLIPASTGTMDQGAATTGNKPGPKRKLPLGGSPKRRKKKFQKKQHATASLTASSAP